MAGIYIHIPFCHSKCAYCDFYSGPLKADHDKYVDALIRELDARRQELGEEPVRTIYLGGGTPSCLSAHLLDRLISHLPIDHVEEFTIEVNPEDITPDMARYLASSPITRISMGVQSLNDAELKAIGRRHSAIDAIKAIELLRSHDITELSIDLIFGLPYQTDASWLKTLREAMDLEVPHFSAYLLSYEPGTRLYIMRETGKIAEADEEEVTARYNMLTEMARDKGYEHYEISNYALSGHRSRHNYSYWNGTPYLGLGTGAHSFDGHTRRANPTQIKRYISHDFAQPFFTVEEESDDEKYNDHIITALRTSEGIDLDRHISRYGEALLQQASDHIAAGNLVIKDGHLIIPENRWLIADRIMTDFMRV